MRVSAVARRGQSSSFVVRTFFAAVASFRRPSRSFDLVDRADDLRFSSSFVAGSTAPGLGDTVFYDRGKNVPSTEERCATTTSITCRVVLEIRL